MATRKGAATKLVIKVAAGMNAAGRMTYKERTFANVNPALTDEDFLSVGGKLAALQSAEVGSIVRQDTASVIAG